MWRDLPAGEFFMGEENFQEGGVGFPALKKTIRN